MTFKHEQRTASQTWIVVADCSRARILCQRKDATDDPTEVKSLEYADSRLHAHEQVSDQPGYFKGRSGSLDAGDPKTDFKHRMAQRFAREIVQVLESGRQHGEFGHLVLIAAPMFLGELKSQLRDPLLHLVRRSIDKDYTALSSADIAVRLNND
jgi:protein required for attachment to host cells